MSDRDDSGIKRMAELLRKGATMLAQACPQCGAPLMKVGDDVYCATCNRRIVYAKDGTVLGPEAETGTDRTLPEVRETILEKVRAVNEALKHENDIEVLTKLGNLLVLLLRALRELGKIR